MSKTHTYPQQKVQLIKDLEMLIGKYSTIGLTNLDGVASNVLQNLRKALRGDTEIKVAKNTLKKLSIEKAAKKHPKIKKLLPYLKGNTGFIFTNKSPFSLQRFFNSNKVDVSAKPGQIATREVYISGGQTDMSPGPVIGELNSIGVRTSVESGKIKINADTKVLDAGDEITETHASILSRLGIKPLSVGMSLHLALEESGDLLFEKDLNINEDEILEQLGLAWAHGIGLSLTTGYPTKETINSLLSQAYGAAINLSVEAAYPMAENIASLLAKAFGQATALHNLQSN